jgi:hypothetical protein
LLERTTAAAGTTSGEGEGEGEGEGVGVGEDASWLAQAVEMRPATTATSFMSPAGSKRCAVFGAAENGALGFDMDKLAPPSARGGGHTDNLSKGVSSGSVV